MVPLLARRLAVCRLRRGRARSARAPNTCAVFQVAGCVAFIGYAMALPQNSIWWGRSWSWTIRNMLDGLLYGLLTGGTFGWLWPK